MKKLLVICLLWLVYPIYVQADSTHECQGNSPCNTGGGDGTGGAGGAGGDATSTSTSNPTQSILVESPNVSLAGGSQTIVFPEQPDKLEIKNTPSMGVGDVFPTTPCYQPQVNGALSLPGFGFSGNKGKIDKGCVEREEIRLASAFGWKDLAKFRWCSLDNNVLKFGSLSKCINFDIAALLKVKAPGVIEPSGDLLAQIDEEEFEEQKVIIEELRVKQSKLEAWAEQELQAKERQQKSIMIQQQRQQQQQASYQNRVEALLKAKEREDLDE